MQGSPLPASFAQAKPVPVPNLLIQLSSSAPYFLGSPFLHREGGQGVRFRTSDSKHRQSVILTVASERSLRGRISDSFAKAKPVPVPSLRIPLTFLADSGGEIRPLGAGVTLPDSFAKAKPVPFRVSASNFRASFVLGEQSRLTT